MTQIRLLLIGSRHLPNPPRGHECSVVATILRGGADHGPQPTAPELIPR
jgi:hypothetical protein